MKEIYDNGEKVLGRIYDLKEYICRNCEDYEEVKEIIEELENYDEDTIAVIKGVCETIISNEKISGVYNAEEINKIKNDILNAKIN